MSKSRLSVIWEEHKYIILLLAAIFVERIMALCILGTTYTLENDDLGYVYGGFHFYLDGIITIYTGLPSAMVMPGLPALLGVMAGLFGMEDGFWLAVKLLYAVMGTATALVVYKTVLLLLPKKWVALLGAAAFLAPNLAWMDNLILTETPYFLCFTLTVYLTLLMGRTDSKKVFAAYCVAFMAGLLLRGTMITMPAFSLLYLFLRKKDRKMLLRRLVVGIVVLMIFMVPWTIRNYHYFDAFVPLSYGVGNPALEGSYQGFGYPLDEELDYDTNVEQVYRERYADYLDEDGNVLDPIQEQYLALERNGIKAEYRMKTWWESNPVSMLLSYLVIKPGAMLVKSFYWQELFGVPELALDALRVVNFFLCCAAVLLAWKRKEMLWELGFLTLTYWIYVYMIGTSFAFSRYGETLMSLRYVIGAVGVYFLVEALRK